MTESYWDTIIGDKETTESDRKMIGRDHKTFVSDHKYIKIDCFQIVSNKKLNKQTGSDHEIT